MRCPHCHAVILIPPRSTGEGSQNHHVNGHIQTIARETGNDFDTVKAWVKMEAVGQGYPFKTFRGAVVPQSEALSSVAECGILIDVTHRLAAELNIKLVENETS